MCMTSRNAYGTVGGMRGRDHQGSYPDLRHHEQIEVRILGSYREATGRSGAMCVFASGPKAVSKVIRR